MRFAALFALLIFSFAAAQEPDLSGVCGHEDADNVKAPVELKDRDVVYNNGIRWNQSHLYYHQNVGNMTTLNQKDEFRKLIINLEPCRGVVYLFVRKTRRCYPNPYSLNCVDLSPDPAERKPEACQWTHFLSQIDGSRDGTPTFFEIPFSSTRYYMTVMAVRNSAYTLTVLADTGQMPRPGNMGKITGAEYNELAVQITWNEATYSPPGYTHTRRYWLYSSMLLEQDERTNMACFLKPDKIMNTACGLENNTDRPYTKDLVPSKDCNEGLCMAIVDGVISGKRYVFNIVAESYSGIRFAYAGLVMRADWQFVRQATTDKTLRVIGAISGSVMAMIMIIYFLMLKLYG